jgi:hypothetical protein
MEKQLKPSKVDSYKVANLALISILAWFIFALALFLRINGTSSTTALGVDCSLGLVSQEWCCTHPRDLS